MNNIDALNSKLVSSIDDKYPIDLPYGKMGICIYFYYLSRWEDKEEYKQIAEKLLDEITGKLSSKKNVGVAYTSAGIAIGISHLVKEKFIEGDINEILEDMDSHIFKTLAFLKDEEFSYPKPMYLLFLYYLQLRYTAQSSSEGKYIFQELIIKTVELFQEKLPVDFFGGHFSFDAYNYSMPFYLYVVSKIYGLNIYNQRLTNILQEKIGLTLSTIPVLQANRLYMMWGLLCIKPYLPIYKKEIEAHVRLLKEKINIEYIMNVEFKNQDIYFKDGLSLVYFLLFFIQMKYPEYKIDCDPQLFINKINTSEAWKALMNRDYYYHKHMALFDGFPGAYLVSLHIKKHFQ